MATVDQLNEACVGLVFGAEEHFRQCVCITNAAQSGAQLTANADATMTTTKLVGAGLLANGSIARLMAQPRAHFMRAPPATWLFTWRARCSAFVAQALRMAAAVGAISLAGWTVRRTITIGFVTTDENSATFCWARSVQSASVTLATCSTALMATLENLLAWPCACHQNQIHVFLGAASNGYAVATWTIYLDHGAARSGIAHHAASQSTAMTARIYFRALCHTIGRPDGFVAGNLVFMPARQNLLHFG